MATHLLPIAFLVFFGALSLLFSRLPRVSHLLGSGGAAAAGLVGLGTTVAGLVSGEPAALALPWNSPVGGSFSIGFDALSGIFLLAIYLLMTVCAVFGGGYLSHLRGKRGLGSHWLFYAVLGASMAMVTLARNGILFLFAWEIMSLSSWLLVTFDHDREDVRQAGVTYLVATQIGTAFLLVMFLAMSAMGGGPSAPSAAAFDFSRFTGTAGPAAGAVFILAIVGFGTKAGIVPLHVWLPEAHPAAPSHVSALMSGVMIKTGIYGIARVLSFLGAPPAWWGWTLVVLGAVSGVMGVLFALAQHDIKKLLAYHSVENIGIITLGLGIGLLGTSYGAPVVAALGFAGAFLHVINHALFKGLLFLGAGAAAHATGTRDIDRLGGLLKRMPWTGAAFLVGAAAICGLPPLNGFVSEILVFSAAFQAVSGAGLPGAVAGGLVIVSLALVGGLAVACFTKVFGIVFLGEPRTSASAAAHEQSPSLVAPMLLLAVVCAAVGLLGPLVVSGAAGLAGQTAGIPLQSASALLLPMHLGLGRVLAATAVLAGVLGLLAVLRLLLLRKRKVREAGTWDCGYVKPDTRMQYTASSYAQPLTGMFHAVLGGRTEGEPVAGLFPSAARFSSDTPDSFLHLVFRPVFSTMGSVFSWLRWLQHGRLQMYVLYIAAALLALFVWRLS
jgi:hydrogenase-4 component B